MREAKSISKKKIIDELKFNGNLSKGGTDHRERKLSLSIKKKDRRKR